VTEQDRPPAGITLRIAHAADADRLATLAQLDSARIPAGIVLIAEVDGRLAAALSIDGGEAIADPLHRTADVVALLRLRAAQLTGRDAATPTNLPALERRSTQLRSAKPFGALRRLA
jgi:hypothetical protein